MEVKLPDLREWGIAQGIHPDDVDAMERIGARLSHAPDAETTWLATHCAELLVVVAGVLRLKDGDTIELGGVVAGMSHTCPRTVEAAIYLLAHAFEHSPGQPSSAVAWAEQLVNSLLDQAS